MTNEKKMTQVQALENAITMFEQCGTTEEELDTLAVLKNMVEKRKNRTSKPRVNKEALAFREELLDTMEELGFAATNAELAEVMNVGRPEDVAEYKPQKIANNIRVLEREGKVIRIRGEKASDKDTFALA